MSDIHAELRKVRQDLQEVENELDLLLQRQTRLIERKDELEVIMRLQNSSASAAAKDTKWDHKDFDWSSKLDEKMGSVFGIEQLRPMQLQTMNVTMSGKDCILIMPTGGGKSLCFQLPALVSKGVTLVVSPLISLMEDQVMSLHGYNVDATMLNASTPKEELKRVQDAMLDKQATMKLLYVTPEKLAKSKRFMAKLEKMYQAGRFARLVIDEVHCSSQWGHDFRPDYKFLGIMKRQFPSVPILGLTATATVSVLEDVKKILNIPDCHVFKASFNRPNLYYEVREKPPVQKDVMEELSSLIASRFSGKSGIIYTFSKKESEDVAADLQSRGIKAGCYHADMSAKQRSYVHRQWIKNNIHVVVATVAFGMGIDKPDVRFVIHHSLSKSMENLYQESGRAGRDDQKSHCIVYYRFQDVFRQSTMVMAEQTGLKNLYGIMEYCTDISRCRRSMIAKHFGEAWDSSHCNNMCDHCANKHSIEKKDVSQYCVNALKIIDNAVQMEQRLTSNKLVDAWQGRGPSVSKVKGTDTATAREKLERLLAHMLLQDYLREDFHFTPYSTISYLVPGSIAGRVRSGREKVLLEMAGKSITHPAAANSNFIDSKKSQPSMMTLENSKAEKPKLVIVNEKNSEFTNFVKTTSDDLRGQTKSDSSKQTSKGGKCSLLKKSSSLNFKKRKGVVDSDTDSEGLDFGNSQSSTNVKKIKKSSAINVTSNKSGTTLSEMGRNSENNSYVNSHGDSQCEPSTSGHVTKNGHVTKKRPMIIKGELSTSCHVTKKRPMIIESDDSDDCVDSVVTLNGNVEKSIPRSDDSMPAINTDKGADKGGNEFDAVCVLDSDSDF